MKQLNIVLGLLVASSMFCSYAQEARRELVAKNLPFENQLYTVHRVVIPRSQPFYTYFSDRTGVTNTIAITPDFEFLMLIVPNNPHENATMTTEDQEDLGRIYCTFVRAYYNNYPLSTKLRTLWLSLAPFIS